MAKHATLALSCIALASPLAAPVFGLADEATRSIRFKLVNGGPHRIRAVYVSPSNRPGWGENLLGGQLDLKQAKALQAEGLKAGQRAEVTLAGPCGLYDVRLVAEKGVEFIEDEVELCEDGDVVTVGERALKRIKQADVEGRR